MKIDRLIGILTLLLQNDKITAPHLAERFEVSRRTIMRDVETLCHAGIPIVTLPGGNGGISIMDGYKINKNVLTMEELQNLAASLKGLDSVSGTSSYRQLMGKLIYGQMDKVTFNDSIVIDLSSHYKESLSAKIALLKAAIEGRNKVCFDYYYEKGMIKREADPIKIEFRWEAWYLLGWCSEKQEFRRFKLNRLWELQVMPEVYEIRPIEKETEEASDTFPDHEHMEVLFHKSVRFRLIETYGLHCYEEREDGLLLLLDYTNKEYIFSWILGFGDAAEILTPLETRNEFALLVRKLSAKYYGT